MREISARSTVRADRDTVDELLLRDLDAILGARRAIAGQADGHRIPITMELGDGTSVSQDVAVELGRPERGDDTTEWPISWEPIGRRALVPELSGHLGVRRLQWNTELVLSGRYRAPLGPLGALGDLLVHDRAESAIASLLDEVARRIDARAASNAETAHGHRLAPEPFERPGGTSDRG